MNFLQKKAKSSIDAIYIIPDDIEDYLDSQRLYSELSFELDFILSHDFVSSLSSKSIIIPDNPVVSSKLIPNSIEKPESNDKTNLLELKKHSGISPIHKFKSINTSLEFSNPIQSTEDYIDSSISIPKVTKPIISLDDANFEITFNDNLKQDSSINKTTNSFPHSDLKSSDSSISTHDSDSSHHATNSSPSDFNSINPSHSSPHNDPSFLSLNPNFKLFQDLADIDRILGNISFSDQNTVPPSLKPNADDKNVNSNITPLTNDLISKRSLEQLNNNSSRLSSNSKFSIGSIVSPSSDVSSYNNSSVLAYKDSLYRIVSFVALDSSDIVVDSSSSFGLSYRDFSSSHPSNSTLFILSKEPDDDIDILSWASRDISLDLPLCIGSFSNLSSFSNVSS